MHSLVRLPAVFVILEGAMDLYVAVSPLLSAMHIFPSSRQNAATTKRQLSDGRTKRLSVCGR
jgi:hypothetical protein